MHDEEIKVVNPPVRKLLLANWLDFVAIMERIPELADNEEIFTLDKAILDCPCYSLASFLLVAVICESLRSALDLYCWPWRHTTRSIKQPVARLDCIVYGIRACCVVNLPQTKANLWHRMAAVELDGR
jgi:hypothetical protein